MTSVTHNSAKWVSPPFSLRKDGVYYTHQGKKGDGNTGDTVFVCKPLEVIGRTRDIDGHSWGRILRWKDPEGREHVYAMPCISASERGAFWDVLLDRGFDVPIRNADRSLLLQYILSGTVPPQLTTCVHQTGWVNPADGCAFVLPDRSFGNQNVAYQTNGSSTSPFSKKGTLAGWQETIGELSSGNSRMMLSVSAAFAAILVQVLNKESGGFHFVGNSSTGKTTTLAAAASVWGRGAQDPGYIRTWRSTGNGIEAVSALHCDTLLCLDEIGQVSPEDLQKAAYSLANGQGKARATTLGTLRASAVWRLIFLSSGEMSLADKLSEAGKGGAKAGQEVRFIDIPADAGCSLGVFEDLHGRACGATLSREICEAAVNHYGFAAESFLEALFELGFSESSKLAQEFHAAAMARLLDGDAPAQVGRVADRFALVAAAGESAIAWGVLPWRAGDAIEAIRICFKAWCAERGGTEDAEIGKMVTQVRQFFALNGAARFAPIGVDLYPTVVSHRAGYRVEEREFYVYPEIMKSEILRGFNEKWARKVLYERGMLLRQEPNRWKVKKQIPGHSVNERFYLLQFGRDEYQDDAESSDHSGICGINGRSAFDDGPGMVPTIPIIPISDAGWAVFSEADAGILANALFERVNFLDSTADQSSLILDDLTVRCLNRASLELDKLDGEFTSKIGLWKEVFSDLWRHRQRGDHDADELPVLAGWAGGVYRLSSLKGAEIIAKFKESKNG